LQKNLQKNDIFKIGKKVINKGKTFIVAEISSNHNNSFRRAKKLILRAKKAGADAIKLQTFTADTIALNSNKKDFKLKYLKKNKSWSKYKNFYEMYKKASTPWSWHKDLFEFAKKIKIEIFSSPFDESAVDFLEKLNCIAYKVASPEITHIPLLDKIAKTKKPVIISTGLAEENDIKLALKTLKKYGNKKIVILKCNSSYPAEPDDSDLKNISYLKERFNLPVGFSDHSIGNIVPVAAVSLGACVIEKHFNLSDKVKTLDSFFSTSEKEFEDMIEKIREVEKVLGKFNYRICRNSMPNLRVRRSIYVSKNINVGEKISKSNIKVVRPSYGLHPKYYSKIVGKKVKRNLEKGHRLKLQDIKI